MGYHNPVLLKETVDGLNIKPDGVYVDVTFGGGGHSREIMKRLGLNGKLFVFERQIGVIKLILEFSILISESGYLLWAVLIAATEPFVVIEHCAGCINATQPTGDEPVAVVHVVVGNRECFFIESSRLFE